MRRATAMLAALGAALVAAAPSSGTFPAPGQRVLLVSEGIEGATLSLVDANGLNFRSLGFNVGVRGTASFAPNGAGVAVTPSIPLDPFSTGSPSDVYVGSFLDGFENLTNDPAQNGRAAWSPDGQRIAFASNADGDWDIYVASAGVGGGATNITGASHATDRNPRWSPDGKWIAFESDRSGNLDVYRMATDGSTPTDLTSSPGADVLGDWSPDSSRIVFSSTRDGDADLYSVAASGGAAARITNFPGDETHAAWSPDGRLIAYSSDADGDNDAFVVGATGGTPLRLTANESEDLVQDWQPLQDLAAPVARAVRSTGRRGRPAFLRFKLAENSGRAAVELDFRLRTALGEAIGFTSVTIARVDPSRVYRVRVDFRGLRLPQRFTFCVQAADASLNIGPRTCARFSYAKAKPKPRRRR